MMPSISTLPFFYFNTTCGNKYGKFDKFRVSFPKKIIYHLTLMFYLFTYFTCLSGLLKGFSKI